MGDTEVTASLPGVISLALDEDHVASTLSASPARRPASVESPSHSRPVVTTRGVIVLLVEIQGEKGAVAGRPLGDRLGGSPGRYFSGDGRRLLSSASSVSGT